LLVGAGNVLDTGPLALELPPGHAARLLLRAEMAPDNRPARADPLDIRAILDWLEPQLEFEPARLQAEVQRRAPRLVPAWNDWTVRAAPAAGPFLANVWDDSPARAGYRLDAVAGAAGLSISRRLQISPQKDRLLVVVTRPEQASPSRVALRVEGQPVREFEVPVRRWGPGRSTIVPLAEYQGRQITVEWIQTGQDAQSLVEWEKLELRGSP
jgi:hypothetical protein